jgi:hypothetical protein
MFGRRRYSLMLPVINDQLNGGDKIRRCHASSDQPLHASSMTLLLG